MFEIHYLMSEPWGDDINMETKNGNEGRLISIVFQHIF